VPYRARNVRRNLVPARNPQPVKIAEAENRSGVPRRRVRRRRWEPTTACPAYDQKHLPVLCVFRPTCQSWRWRQPPWTLSDWQVVISPLQLTQKALVYRHN